MGKFIDQEIDLILGIAIGLWGGTGDFFVAHCVVSSVIVLFVGCWLFVVDLKLVGPGGQTGSCFFLVQGWVAWTRFVEVFGHPG